MSTLKAMRDMVAEPSNRPAFNLLAKGTLMMVTFPIATYFLCFEYVFAKGGLYDLSEEFNLRINFSGFCALFVVQICIGTFVLMAFQQDDEQFAEEKKAKEDTIQRLKDERERRAKDKTEKEKTGGQKNTEEKKDD
mmetsp:Transcript_31793/g.74902  ORF Transcript_31793/g.74902 Transcript_31793/m.74902 type:complete len:136 (+) Transcript_31793:140-547(+)